MISPEQEETKRLNSVVTAPPQACNALNPETPPPPPQTPKKPEAPAGAGGAVLVKVEDPRHFPTLRWFLGVTIRDSGGLAKPNRVQGLGLW